VCGSIATKPLIAVGSDSGSLHLLDLNSRTQLKHVAGAHRSPVAGIATSKSASAVLASCGADQVIRLWDGNDLRFLNILLLK
jgi:WD40 repeat protein